MLGKMTDYDKTENGKSNAFLPQQALTLRFVHRRRPKKKI